MSPRPTVEGLAHTTDMLEQLAYDRSTEHIYHQFASMLTLAVWVTEELGGAERAAGWGHGTDMAVIGGGSSRPVEARLDWGAEQGHRGKQPAQVEPSDPLYKQLRKVRTEMSAQLTSMAAAWEHACQQAANYPTRTREAGFGG